jgi:hypothetical protein
MEIEEDGSDLSIEDNLWRAAGEGAVDRVLGFLGTAADQPDENGYTALMAAVAYRHAHLAEVLLGRGAKLNVKDGEGNTALHHCDSIDCLQLLLAKGANLNLKNNAGETALDVKKEDLRELEEEADLEEEEAEAGHMEALVAAFQEASASSQLAKRTKARQ